MNRPGKMDLTQRSCSVCGKKTLKPELSRVALFEVEKKLKFDSSLTLGGRGLYICKSYDCVVKFITKLKKGKMKNISTYPMRRREQLIEDILEYSSSLIKNEGGS